MDNVRKSDRNKPPFFFGMIFLSKYSGSDLNLPMDAFSRSIFNPIFIPIINVNVNVAIVRLCAEKFAMAV